MLPWFGWLIFTVKPDAFLITVLQASAGSLSEASYKLRRQVSKFIWCVSCEFRIFHGLLHKSQSYCFSWEKGANNCFVVACCKTDTNFVVRRILELTFRIVVLRRSEWIHFYDGLQWETPLQNSSHAGVKLVDLWYCFCRNTNAAFHSWQILEVLRFSPQTVLNLVSKILQHGTKLSEQLVRAACNLLAQLANCNIDILTNSLSGASCTLRERVAHFISYRVAEFSFNTVCRENSKIIFSGLTVRMDRWW